MHYFKRNIGDYHKKAGRLSMLEHGAYTLLLDACYDRERFPTMDDAIEWTWARTDEEIAAVRFVLGKFFDLEDGLYVQQRVKEEIEAYQAKSLKNQEIALAREEARRAKRERIVHETCTDRHLTTNQEPLTTNHKPEDKSFCGVSVQEAVKDDAFESAWRLYPKREGSNPKNKAHSAWKARLKDGVSVDDMVQGLARYVAYCKARGSVGTEYVMQAQRFFGPSKEFANDWKPAAQQNQSRHHGFDKIDYSKGLGQENTDGSFNF